MFPPPDVLIESKIRAGLDHWRGFLLIAAFWMGLAPLVPWCFMHHYRVELSRETVLVIWTLIAGVGIIASWITIRNTYFAVMPGQLQIGRSPRETIVEFSEIESIVVGLPAYQSRLERISRFDHTTVALREKMARMRQEAIFLRLRDGHYLALYISRFLIANADALKSTLLTQNRSKVIGPDSYTPEEIKYMRNIYYNMMRIA